MVAPFAVRTPPSFPVLNERVGTKVFLKPEMLQRTGSFKFRGAFNKLASIPPDKRARGWSCLFWSHAQGVAVAAQIPACRPRLRRRRTLPSPNASARRATRRVVLYDRDKEDREAIANGIAAKRGATLVRPYDDPFVIAARAPQAATSPRTPRRSGRP